MNIVAKSEDRTLISMTSEELRAIANSLNEVCNGVHISDSDFETRLGVSRAEALSTLARISAACDTPAADSEICVAWEDQGSVMVKVINVYGDPVELGEVAAQEFLISLTAAIEAAS